MNKQRYYELETILKIIYKDEGKLRESWKFWQCLVKNSPFKWIYLENSQKFNFSWVCGHLDFVAEILG